MIIGLDGNEANVEKRVGIGEYALELLKQFKNSKVPNLKFQIYLKNKPMEHMPKESDDWQYKVFGPKKMWTQLALPVKLFSLKKKPDIFFTPSHYAPRFSPVPTVISIMDLSYFYFPQLFNKNDLYQLVNWTKYSAKKAAKIFTISNASRDDIIKQYKVDQKKVIVTYPGIKQISDSKSTATNMEDVTKKFNIKKPYVLFVGTLQPRKNLTNLIHAFSRLANKDLELVLVGKRGWMYQEILDAPEKYNVKDRVIFLDFVADSELPILYENASCFVLPSLYEGFGLPVLEAMKYGCPVVTSNISSLPEVGGDAAIYFNPTDIQDMTSKINKVVSDDKLRKEMRKKGFEQVKKFSWEKTAKQTLEALKEIVNEG